MKSEGLNYLLPRITLRLPLTEVFPLRSLMLESPSSPPIPVLDSCGLSPCQMPFSPTTTAANTYCALSRNRAFPALPLTALSAFPTQEPVLPRITLCWAGVV